MSPLVDSPPIAPASKFSRDLLLIGAGFFAAVALQMMRKGMSSRESVIDPRLEEPVVRPDYLDNAQFDAA